MNRGGSHQNIFKDESDYQYMLRLLQSTKEKFPFYVHAYCLMTNHYHFLIETLNDDISNIMKRIDSTYTRYFNVKYGRDGSLFRGRFKSCEVATDDYFLQTSRYISLNPVKAHMVPKPECYQWGSYSTLIGLCDDHITDKNRTLNFFSDQSPEQYKSLVESKMDHSKTEEQICKDLGDEVSCDENIVVDSE